MLLHITGDYVLIANPNDLYPSDYLENLAKIIETNNSEVIISGIATLFPDKLDEFKIDIFDDKDFFAKTSLSPINQFYEGGLFWGWYLLGNKLINKEILDRSFENYYEFASWKDYSGYTIAEDMLLCANIFSISESVAYITRTYMIFNWSSEDNSFIKNNDKITETVNLLYDICTYIKNNSISNTGTSG